MAGHGLRLTDLDDFLSPAEECMKPDVLSKGGEGVHLVVEDGATFEVSDDGSKSKLQDAVISLADCLSCSGCITSAESILVSQQSKEAFLKQAESGDKYIIVSISPHARASLATWLGMSCDDVQKRLIGVLQGLGVSHVLDGGFAHSIEAHERCLEFEERLLVKEKNSSSNQLPMLESTCPGWICFAEKTQESILSLVSRTKSAQQIMGSYVKDYIAPKLGKTREDVYHVFIAPCHDKKLEASRYDFQDSAGCRDVDTVLTANELQTLLLERNIDLKAMPACTPDLTLPQTPMKDDLSRIQSSWGGNLEIILQHAGAIISSRTTEPLRIERKEGRNTDIYEYILYAGDVAVLYFSAHYGFRNIQNLVRKLKRGKASYDYVEVMACPGACLNGGGQVPPSRSEKPRDLLTRVTETFSSATNGENDTHMEVDQTQFIRHQLPESAATVYRDWIQDVPGSEKARSILHTQFHPVPKTEQINPAFIKW